MTDYKQKLATTAVITITLDSLANGASRESAAIDNSTNLYVDAYVTVSVQTNGSAPTGSKSCLVELKKSEDGTVWDEPATGSDAGVTPTSPSTFNQLGVIPCPSASTTYSKTFYIPRLPRKWGIVVTNNTGNALESTGHSASFTGATFQSV